MKRQATNETIPVQTVRDKLLCHVETAIAALRTRNPSDTQIHRVRKALKRGRAELRLLRDAIGNRAYRRENVALRDAARPLRGVRDAAVLRTTSDTLIRTTRRGPCRRLLLTISRTLEQSRHEARAELRMMNVLNTSAARLVAAAARIRKWRLERADTASVTCGLQRIYRQGRKALKRACADSTTERFHEWRKQVKYLGEAMKVWKAHDRGTVKSLIKRADKLADLLGTDHDLVVFEARLEKLTSTYPIQPALTRSLAGQRCDLRDTALKKGRRFFKATPRSFVREIAHDG